jgi:anti-anti-sigma factor
MPPGPLPSQPLSGDSDAFRCEVVREEAGAARVRIGGALDIAAVPVLEATVGELREAGVQHVILDLSELDFMDSTGLRCILERDAEARQDGVSLSLVAGPPAVQRVFELTGTAARLPFIAG